MSIHNMQNLCRRTIDHICANLKSGLSIGDIRTICEEYMLTNGADSFWYWNIGAFVFGGKDTVISVSGKDYKTPNYIIEADDIITIDLSPQSQCIWGDYARTIVIERG